MQKTQEQPTYVFVVLVAIALVIAVFAYWPGLSGPLMLDDIPQLKPLIDRSSETPSALFTDYLMSTSGPLGRPVAMASFILDANAHGDDIWWWKLESLLIHLACSLLIFGFISCICSAATGSAGENYRWVAVLVAGLWLVHPLNVSTVLYTVQRMTILSTFFVLCGLVCYSYGRLQQVRHELAGWFPIVAAFLVFLPLAALSKESGLLLVVYITLLEFVVFRFQGARTTRKYLLAIQTFAIAAYLATLILVLVNPEFVLASYEARDFSLIERVMTQPRVLVAYLQQILFPLPIWMGFFHDDFSISAGLLSPLSTLFSSLIILGLVSAAIYFRRRSPLFAFGVLFFFASHLMESTILGLELMFEHRNYTGLPGILLAIIAPLAALTETQKRLHIVGLVVFLGFALLTWQRALIWAEPVSMYQHMYAVHPDSRRLNIIHANAYAATGDFEGARRALARIAPSPGRELQGVFFECIEHGHVEDAMLEAVNMRQGVVNAHVTSSLQAVVSKSLASECRMSHKALLEMIDRLLSLKKRSPADHRAVLATKAELLEGMHRLDEALATYELMQQITSENALPLYLAADMLVRHGRFDDALTVLSEAGLIERQASVTRDKLAEKMYLAIAEQYVVNGRFEDAAKVYEQALSVIPKSESLNSHLESLRREVGRSSAATAGSLTDSSSAVAGEESVNQAKDDLETGSVRDHRPDK